MSEYKKKAMMFALIAVLAAAGVAAVISGLSLTGTSGPSGQEGRVSQTAQTTMVGISSEPGNDFTLQGPIPVVTLTPKNNTFVLIYNATTLSNPVTNLSFNLSQSYITTYTNGTIWAPYSKVCASYSAQSSPTNESVASESSIASLTVVSVTDTANSCDYPATLGWAPVNGTVVSQYAKLSPGQVELSMMPTSVAANTTMSLQFKITLNLKPGVYEIGLGIGVQTNNFLEFSDLNPFPVIVKS